MNGVIQVGAHAGEEVNGWLNEGRSPIVCFEPQALPRVHRPSPNVIWIQMALGDSASFARLYVPHHLTEAEGLDTQSASLLKLIPERAIENGWVPTKIEHYQSLVPVLRFDQWAEVIGFDVDSCSLLKIDVQGYEGQVLAGFGDYVDAFSEIVVECSSPPLYEGGVGAHYIETFLTAAGFTRQSPIVQHGDVRYTK